MRLLVIALGVAAAQPVAPAIRLEVAEGSPCELARRLPEALAGEQLAAARAGEVDAWRLVVQPMPGGALRSQLLDEKGSSLGERVLELEPGDCSALPGVVAALARAWVSTRLSIGAPAAKSPTPPPPPPPPSPPRPAPPTPSPPPPPPPRPSPPAAAEVPPVAEAPPPAAEQTSPEPAPVEPPSQPPIVSSELPPPSEPPPRTEPPTAAEVVAEPEPARFTAMLSGGVVPLPYTHPVGMGQLTVAVRLIGPLAVTLEGALETARTQRLLGGEVWGVYRWGSLGAQVVLPLRGALSVTMGLSFRLLFVSASSSGFNGAPQARSTLAFAPATGLGLRYRLPAGFVLEAGVDGQWIVKPVRLVVRGLAESFDLPQFSLAIRLGLGWSR